MRVINGSLLLDENGLKFLDTWIRLKWTAAGCLAAAQFDLARWCHANGLMVARSLLCLLAALACHLESKSYCHFLSLSAKARKEQKKTQSGKKESSKTNLLGLAIVQCSGGLPREGVGME